MSKKHIKKKLQKKDFTREQIRLGNIVTNLSFFFGFVSLFTLYYFFITPEYNNIISYTSTFWLFGIVGALSYIILHYRYIVKRVVYLKYLETKGRNAAGAIIFAFVFLPSIIFIVNNKLANEGKLLKVTVKVLDKNETSRRIQVLVIIILIITTIL
jgi:hypothetical protein